MSKLAFDIHKELVRDWAVYEQDQTTDENVHVIPRNDSVPHIEAHDCPCEPDISPEGAVIHNAWDGRK